MTVRMRHTKAHTRNRRSHHALKNGPVVVDQKTKVPHLRHRVCMETGMYKGKQVLKKAAAPAENQTQTEEAKA